MKAWEDMNNKERAEQTFKDIKRRQALRTKGKYDAIDYSFEQAAKANIKRNKIRCKSYRGK